jgi:hypothetical protein
MRKKNNVEMAAAKMLAGALKRLVAKRRKMRKIEAKRLHDAAVKLELDSAVDFENVGKESLNIKSILRDTRGADPAIAAQMAAAGVSHSEHAAANWAAFKNTVAFRETQERFQWQESEYTAAEASIRKKAAEKIQRKFHTWQRQKENKAEALRLASASYQRAQRWKQRMMQSVIRIDLEQVREDLESEKRLPNYEHRDRLRKQQLEEIAKEAVAEAELEIADIREHIQETIHDALKAREVSKQKEAVALAKRKAAQLRARKNRKIKFKNKNQNQNKKTPAPSAKIDREHEEEEEEEKDVENKDHKSELELEMIKALEYNRVQTQRLESLDDEIFEMERAISFYIDRIGGNAAATVIYNENMQKRYVELLESRRVTVSRQRMGVLEEIQNIKSHIDEVRREKVLTKRQVRTIRAGINRLRREQKLVEATVEANAETLKTYERQHEILETATRTKLSAYEANWNELKAMQNAVEAQADARHKQEMLRSRGAIAKNVSSRSSRAKKKGEQFESAGNAGEELSQKERIHQAAEMRAAEEKRISDADRKAKKERRVQSYLLAFRRISDATGVKTPEELIEFVDSHAARNMARSQQIQLLVAEENDIKERIRAVSGQHENLSRRLAERRGRDQKELNRLDKTQSGKKSMIDLAWKHGIEMRSSIQALKAAIHSLFVELSGGITWEQSREHEDRLVAEASLARDFESSKPGATGETFNAEETALRMARMKYERERTQMRKVAGAPAGCASSNGTLVVGHVATTRARQRRSSISINLAAPNSAMSPSGGLLRGQQKIMERASNLAAMKHLEDAHGMNLGHDDETSSNSSRSSISEGESDAEEPPIEHEASDHLVVDARIAQALYENAAMLKKQRNGEFMDAETQEVLAAIDAKAVEVLFKAAGASIVANRKPRPLLPGARWNGQAGLAAPLGPTIPLDAPNASIRLHDEPYSKRPPQEVEALTDILGTKPARDGHFDLKYAEHQQVSSGLSGHKRRPASPGEDDKWINASREGILSIQRRYIPPKQRKATSPQQGGEDRQHSGATKNKMK